MEQNQRTDSPRRIIPNVLAMSSARFLDVFTHRNELCMPKWQALKTQALKNERRNDAKCTKGTPMMRKPYEHVANRIIGGPSLYFATPRRGTPMMRK